MALIDEQETSIQASPQSEQIAQEGEATTAAATLTDRFAPSRSRIAKSLADSPHRMGRAAAFVSTGDMMQSYTAFSAIQFCNRV
jgi:hypothetical protein